MKHFQHGLCHYRMAVLALTLAIGFFGCTHFFPRVSEQDLQERVSRVWQAKVDGNCTVIYGLTSSKYRSQVTQDEHQAYCRTRIEKFSIARIDYSPDKTTAKVSISFDIKQMGFLIPATLIQEDWIQEGGEWVLDLTPMRSSKSPF